MSLRAVSVTKISCRLQLVNGPVKFSSCIAGRHSSNIHWIHTFYSNKVKKLPLIRSHTIKKSQSWITNPIPYHIKLTTHKGNSGLMKRKGKKIAILTIKTCIKDHFFTVPTNAHLIHFKTLKYLTLASTCFGLFWYHRQGARKLHFAKLLRWDLLIYICYKFVQFVAVCQFIPSVCVSGAWHKYGQNEPTYGHKPCDFITNVNQQIPS